MKKFFFYGIFREYHPAGRDLVKQGGCKFLGEAAIPGYTLYSTPSNSGVFARPKDGGRIVGDLCEVPEDVIPFLDMCEGHPNNYRRTEVKTEDGQDCILYVMQHAVEDHGFPHVGESWRDPSV